MEAAKTGRSHNNEQCMWLAAIMARQTGRCGVWCVVVMERPGQDAEKWLHPSPTSSGELRGRQNLQHRHHYHRVQDLIREDGDVKGVLIDRTFGQQQNSPARIEEREESLFGRQSAGRPGNNSALNTSGPFLLRAQTGMALGGHTKRSDLDPASPQLVPIASISICFSLDEPFGDASNGCILTFW